ncbi:ion transporter [Streptococcus cuniculi]|uniref:Ion transporter n=1 Tax=Streptococcus cuniculi TaxID=1432788 RepID=A0A1Q8E9V6_9STRE|nr:ion transporter [Streptococcus cuniculi]OLF48581.1 ion transporter [Streptococcus cuniculi]
MRKQFYHFIESGQIHHKKSKYYDYGMIAIILLSIVPLLFKQQTPLLSSIDTLTFLVFVVDYLCRWLTADFILKRGRMSFLLYPFSLMAILDLLCILPYISLLNNSFKLLKVIRMIRALRVIKLFRYSKNIRIITNVLKHQKDALLIVGVLATSYIFVSALILFNIEPDTFPSFFDAIYWATISLTTVGYGDIYATSILGKTMTMISALVGIAIVALPAGIITAGYMEEIAKTQNGSQERT